MRGMTALLIACAATLAWVAAIVTTVRLRSRTRDEQERWERKDPRLRVKFTALAAALVVLPVVAVYSAGPLVTCVGGGVDLGVSRRGGECVGVSDGGYHFSGGFPDGEIGEETKAGLDRVMDRIKAQNDIDGPYVKIAMLSPFTSAVSGPRVLHKLEGAAAAQQWINEPGRGSPKIQLWLAHMGSREAQWESVVDQVIDMKDDAEPLVAVVGVGLSQDETRNAARKLADAGIPMVADVLTATNVDAEGPIEGFHRVAYSNDQQYDALFASPPVKDRDLSRAVVVKSDDETDTYASSAADAVAARLPGKPTPIEFGGGGDEGKFGNQFRAISQSLCGTRDAVVFYAGRSRYLANLMQRLDEEGCLDSVLVVSASDAAVLRMRTTDQTTRRNWGVDKAGEVVRKGKVSLYFTALADPVALRDRPQYQEFLTAFTANGNAADDVYTGWAMMAWDTLRVAAEWTWMAQNTVDPDLPTAEDVGRASTLRYSNKDQPFEGATGRFWFGQNGDRLGDPPTIIRLTG